MKIAYGYTVTRTAHALIKDATFHVPINEYMCIVSVTVSVSQFIQRRHLMKEELIWSTGEIIMTGEAEI